MERHLKVLILGGTGDALELAAGLEAAGIATVTSLAGATTDPRLPDSPVRRGGFGGVEGLRSYLLQEHISVIADATHPFAAQMSLHAHAAAEATATPLFRLERPAWRPQPGDNWASCTSAEMALRSLPAGARVLLTIGRKEASMFLARTDIGGVARMIETPPFAIPPGWRLILERPPFTVESEKQLITHDAITHLVTRNAGGDATSAKLEAARALALPVLMIERPVKPQALSFPAARDLIPAIRRALLP